MSKVKDFIAQNNLQWQASFNERTDKYAYGYRGSLIITPGVVMSADKQLPPKATATQTILATNNETIDFLACELETLDFFEPFVAMYKDILSPKGLYILFITDLDGNGKFEYEGLTFNAFSLDESSVWNELVDFADLSKGDLKKLTPAEKIDTICDEIKSSHLRIKDRSYEEIKALKNESKAKMLFGAV